MPTPPKPIAYAQALELLSELARATPRPREWRTTGLCLSAVLTDAIHAPTDVPGFRHSAMDGYALPHPGESFGSFAEGTRFRLTGATLAGGAELELAAGDCVAVATGAMVPASCSTVVPKENVALDGSTVVLRQSVPVNANIRSATDDFTRGHPIAAAGRSIDAALIATASTCGLARLPVFEALRVVVIVTGDEIVPVDAVARPGQRIDSNGPLVAAWFAERGVAVRPIGPVRDDLALLRQIIETACAEHDLVLVTGGASVGPVDHTPTILHELGEVAFWRVAVKPGMPVLAARVGACVALGLPGNPVSVFAGLHAFVAPLLRRWHQQPDPAPLFARLAEPVRKTHARLEWRRGVLQVDNEGCLKVTLHPSDSSGALRSVVESNVLVELAAEGRAWDLGDLVPILPYLRLFGAA